jgi:hypothetical protein
MPGQEDQYARRISVPEAYRRMLALALEQVGGDREELGRRLWISLEELGDYQSGKQPVPCAVFVGALDIVLSTLRKGPA